MVKKSSSTAKQAAPKTLKRYIRHAEAFDAFRRLRVKPGFVLRFSRGQRVEHFILLVSFTMLGVTGLAQTYSETAIGNFILAFFGGITFARYWHHLFAAIFLLQSVYHVALFLNEAIVYRRISQIWPSKNDLTELVQMMKLNLGFSRRHPNFDRYNFEEKAEYWALVWGTVIMGLTGLIQWFPVQAAAILPGWMIPVSRALHKWEAILAVLAILIWHTYHTVIKTRNFSIFTGFMAIAQMQEEHPMELQYLEKAAALVNEREWPALIELRLEEEHPAPDADDEILDETEETTNGAAG